MLWKDSNCIAVECYARKYNICVTSGICSLPAFFMNSDRETDNCVGWIDTEADNDVSVHLKWAGLS